MTSKRAFCIFLILFILWQQLLYAMPTDGVIFPEEGKWKIGTQTNLLFEKRMKRPKGDLESEQYFNMVSYAPFTWLSLDFRYGWGNVKFDPKDGESINYNTAFAGGYGFRARLMNQNKRPVDVIYSFQHISVHPDPRKVEEIKNEICLDDWQASFILSKRINFFNPYAGLKYSKVILTRITSDVKGRKTAGSVDHLGLAVGADFAFNSNLYLNVEGRFFDEQGLNVNLNWKF